MVDKTAPEPRPSVIVPIECAGDHRTMGHMQGRACREVLGDMQHTMLDMLGAPAEGGLRRVAERASRFVVPAAGVVARRFIAKELKAHYPLAYDRMVGIAAGASVPLSWLFLGPGVELFLNSPSIRRPTGACTALGITGKRSRGGEPMIVKNFDYPGAARETYLVRTSRPGRRGLAASIDVTNAPLPGSHEGINEHGLAVAYNYGYMKGRARARVSITSLVQEIMEQCRTVEDAIERLRHRPRAGSAMLMLADATGSVASVEVSPDDIGVRYAGDHGDSVVHANHAVHPAMVGRDIPHDAVLSRWNPHGMRGVRFHQSSEERHARAETLVREAGMLSEGELATVAADHGRTEHGDDDTICRHGPYYETTCSVMLFPKRRTVKVMFAAPCQADYQLISL
jgi:predicted choloylglycine hydrolase